MTDATEKHLSVSRQDVAAIIEDIRLGCPETAIKHLGAMLAAAPIANPVMSPGASGIASVNDVLDIIDGAIVRLEELGSPPGDVMRMELEDAGKFLSLTKATPAEPVAWQYRLIGPSGPTKWRECNDDVRRMIADTGHYDGVNKSPAELRPLYADIGLTPHSTAVSAIAQERDVGKHTPTPWTVNEDGWRIESRDEHGWANDGWIIGKLDGPDAEANAALIVAAVNAFTTSPSAISEAPTSAEAVTPNPPEVS